MSTRLQVVTLSQWVRSAIRTARLTESTDGPSRRLAVIAHVSEHRFPTGNIAELLAQIESGYPGNLESILTSRVSLRRYQTVGLALTPGVPAGF